VEIPAEVHAAIFVVLALIWVLFFVDYLTRLILTPRGHRWAFVRKNLIDLLSVLFPLFRTFRLVSLLGRIPYFQGRSGTAVRSRVVIYAAGYAILFVYFIALATLQAERYAPGATITSFGDAVWWACVTLFTVGYGDTYPVTVLGRFWAVVLMAGGIVIIGTTSAIVVSYLSERVRRKD
jgi:voltage-gated potassium channel